MKGIFPIWKRDSLELAQSFIRLAFKARLVCVDTAILDPSFAGRTFDEELLRDLPPNVDPCGENGEFHTCVVAGPIFSRPIAVTPGERVERDGYGYCDLVMAPQPRAAQSL